VRLALELAGASFLLALPALSVLRRPAWSHALLSFAASLAVCSLIYMTASLGVGAGTSRAALWGRGLA